MSKHRSYGKKSKSSQRRSVLTRWERIAILRKLGKWEEGKCNVTGLPKTPLISVD
ncbi:small basic protein [Candidatus Similichlamydia epinepheli]|uniref:small basic protein n=1 Tax=Candidatus Similichlamydia epinepheli TaxID=1903953 RepID=UPI000D34D199|nr:small basic protein [Candidatus Similichlamydia epinepheli]